MYLTCVKRTQNVRESSCFAAENPRHDTRWIRRRRKTKSFQDGRIARFAFDQESNYTTRPWNDLVNH